MSGSKPTSNLAARMGRWSADHWKTATFGWLAFVIVAFGLGGLAGTKSIDPNTAGPGESGRMDRILDAGFKRPADESVLIQSRSLTATDPAFTAAIEDVVARVSKLEAVQNVRSPARRGQRGPDLRERPRGARRVRDPRRGRRRRRQDRPGPRRRRRCAAGPPAVLHRRVRLCERRPTRSTPPPRTISARPGSCRFPITLVILVIAFGALVAAGIPLLLALTAVFATFGIVAWPARPFPWRRKPPRSCS